MNCAHERTIAHKLSDWDVRDICDKLEDYLVAQCQTRGIELQSYLTPNLRGGNRAKSMRSTTKTSALSSED